MAAVIDNTNKIVSLIKYVESIKRQLDQAPTRKLNSSLEAYTAWANLEIKRTLADIEKLKV